MKTDLNYGELIREHNVHSTIVNPEGLAVAMNICYQQGRKDGQKEVLDWLSNMDYLSDNINYIKEEWENLQK